MTVGIGVKAQSESEQGDYCKSKWSTIPGAVWFDPISPLDDSPLTGSLKTVSALSLKAKHERDLELQDGLNNPVHIRRSGTWLRQISPVHSTTHARQISPGLLPSVDHGERRTCGRCARVHPMFLACACTLSLGLIRTLMPSPVGLINDSKVAGCESQSLCFCPRETICVKTLWSAILLLIARCSAYFDYPMYMVLFLTKARNFIELLQGSGLSVFLPLENLHKLHELAGRVVALEVFLHTGAHLLRWWLNGTQAFLWTTQTGITGLVAVLCVPLIAWVAMLSALKRKASFELRKALHYLSIIWGVSLCFHAPHTPIFFAIGIPLLVYLLDFAYGFFLTTHLVPTLQMKRVGRSTVEICFENPRGFEVKRPSFIYLCLPWISKLQWHAFSVYSPKEGNTAICISVAGDWTRDLYTQLARPSVRPGFLYGPFACPSATAVQFDNVLCIVSGIGITAALAVLEGYKENRRISVIWVCREQAIIKQLLDGPMLDTKAGMLLYYTGTTPLRLDAVLLERHPRLLLFEGRPDLERTAIQVIRSLETHQALPSRMLAQSQRYFQRVTLGEGEADLCDKLCSQLEIYSVQELFDMAAHHFCRDGGVSALCKHVSRDGFKLFVCGLLSIPTNEENKMQEYIDDVFNKFDVDGDGVVSFDEFLAFFKGEENPYGLASACDVVVAVDHAPSSSQVLSSNASSEPASILSSQSSLSDTSEPEPGCEGTAWNKTWELMYCGSSTSMMRQVQEISKRYSMSFSTESFAW